MSKPGYVTLVGFVATEPRMSNFADGDVANLRIGSTISWIDRSTGEWRNGETSFYSVKCRRSLARNAKKCLRKGEPIVVAGKLRTRSYQDRNGVQRLDVEVEADTIGYDLCRGTAEFRWNQRASAGLSELARGEAIRAGLEHEDDPGPGDPGSTGWSRRRRRDCSTTRPSPGCSMTGAPQRQRRRRRRLTAAGARVAARPGLRHTAAGSRSSGAGVSGPADPGRRNPLSCMTGASARISGQAGRCGAGYAKAPGRSAA